MPGPHKNSGELAKQQAERTNPMAVLDSVVRAAANVMTLGYADQLAAWMDSKVNGTSQEENLAREKAITALDARNNPKAVMTGKVAGIVGGPLALKSVYGFGSAFAARYAGVAATAAVASTATGVAATETLHAAARSLGTRVASSVKDGATLVRDTPVEAAKAVVRMGGKVTGFVAKQVAIVEGSKLIGFGADTAPAILGETSAPDVGREALKVGSSGVMSAGINAGVSLALGLLTRGRSGWGAEIGQGISVMTGVTSVMQGSAEVLASTSSAVQEREYGIAAQSAGYVAAAAATIAGVARYKNIGMQNVWNHMAENRITYALAGYASVSYSKFVGQLTHHKIEMAHWSPETQAMVAETGARPSVVSPAEMPVSAAPASVAVAQPPAVDKQEAHPVTVAHAHAARPRPRPRRQQMAQGTLLGLDPEAKSGFHVASFPAETVAGSEVVDQIFVAPVVAVAAPLAPVPLVGLDGATIAPHNVNLTALGNALTEPKSDPTDGQMQRVKVEMTAPVPQARNDL